MINHIGLILILQIVIIWKIFFSKYKITLVAPILRNTETKELGCWAYLIIKIPFPPFPGLIIHDGRGGIHKVLEVKWDKGDRTITCDSTYDTSIYEDLEGYEHTKKCAVEWKWKLREVPSGHILKSWEER